MKEKELRAHAKCSICHKGLLSTGLPLFYRLKVERFGLDMNALQQQQGLAMFFGGYAMLAQIMGADRDMAHPVMEPVTLTVCEACSHEPILLPMYLEESQVADEPQGGDR